MYRLVNTSSQQTTEVQPHTNDGDLVLGSLELPEGDIDGDTTLTLGLELVKDPCVLEGTLAEFSGFLFDHCQRVPSLRIVSSTVAGLWPH